ncbi:MAG: glycosyltransferase family 4 protein [Nocardioidaceae bacterium]|nr:glycosyltransferase family 4 protein [Nocardioidaceae bacterium]MCL2613023.1 glycosyltransferase family 4 protein [Nocardioidaceae bacterium]
MTLYVDRRHVGHFGIGRYAVEVLPRLGLDHRPLALTRDPMMPLSVVERGWRAPRRRDLIYSPAFWTGSSRAPQVLTVHDLIYLREGAGTTRRLYYERLVAPAARRSGHVLTVSDTSAGELRDWLGDGVEVHVTGNGCSETFTPEGPARAADRPYVLYVGTTKPHKNVGLLVDALAELPDLDLVAITADGKELSRMIRARDLSGRARVVEPVADAELASCYRGAAVLALPSTLEGFGLTALEAICCGTPVAHLRSCAAVAEVVGSDGVGSEADPSSYAEAIRLAAAMPRVARSRPDWSDVARRVREALIEIAPELGPARA